MLFAINSVRARLIVGFSVILALLLGMAALSVVRLQQAVNAARQVEEEVLPTQAANERTALLIQRYRTLEYAHLGALVPEDHPEIEAAMTKVSADLKVEFASLLVHPELNESAVAGLSKIWQAYAAYFDDTIRRDSHEGMANIAIRRMAGDHEQQFKGLFLTLESNTRNLKQVVAHANQANDAMRANTQKLLVAASLLALLAGALIGASTTRSVVVPIRLLIATLNRIAAGDLTSKVEVISKDEVGQLMCAAAIMQARVAERTEQVRVKTNDIQAMLQNMPQGVLTVLPGGLIHPEYSAYMETIFETKDIAGQNFISLLFDQTNLGANDLSQVDAAVGSCIGEDLMNFEFNSHLLVTEFNKTMANGTVKSLQLSWSHIADGNDMVEKLMLCVRDVTEFKRLASEAGAQKRELDIIGEILSVTQEKFQDFIESTYKFVAENEEVIRKMPAKDLDAVGLLFRNMHTIKGNARTYGLQHMTNVLHETEQAYDDLRNDSELAWGPEHLLAQLAQVQALVGEYQRINDVKLGRKGPGRRGSIDRFLMVDKTQVSRAQALIKSVNDSDLAAVRAVLAEVGQTLNMIGTEKVEHVLAGIIESMPSLARELGKEPPRITVSSNDIVLRTQIVSVLKNVFTHVFRNAIDHGIETAGVRQRAGKSQAGHIQLKLALADGRLQLKLSDDGQGLAVGRIRRKAIDIGLLTDADQPSPEAIANLIFASGFSTADKVTEVSGRGVGMDAVKGFLQKEGGDVAICFTDGNAASDQRYFELVMTLPDKYAVQARASDFSNHADETAD